MYRQRVSRAHPTLIVLILDDSGSMRDSLPGTAIPKHQWVEQYAGVIFKELLARSAVAVGDRVEVRSRYFVYVIPYGTSPSVWPAGAAEAMPIDQVIQAYAVGAGGKPSLGLGGRSGRTNTRAAFECAYTFLQGAVAQERFRDSFPPMVFHLTDGASATSPTQVAEQIVDLATTDGKVLLVNALMTARTGLRYAGPSDFPGYVMEDEAGTDRRERQLFRMSSVAPDPIRDYLVHLQIFPQFRPGARLFFDVRTQDMLKHVLAVVGSVGWRS